MEADQALVDESPAGFPSPKAVPPGTPATVYIYRVGDFGAFGMRDAYFYLNDVNIVDLSHRSYTQFQVNPGTYRLTQKWPYDVTFGAKATSLQVRWLPGETYYYKFEARKLPFRTEWRLQSVTDALGQVDTKKLDFRNADRLEEAIAHKQ